MTPRDFVSALWIKTILCIFGLQQVIPTSVHPGSHMDPSAVPGMPQLAAQMSSLQLSTGTSVGDEHTTTL